MGSPHYTPTGNPAAGALGASKGLRDEFLSIETGIQVMNSFPFIYEVDDINTAASRFFSVPWACTIAEIRGVNYTANSTNPTVITAEIGGTLVTMPALQWGSSDAAETVISSVPTAGNVLTKGGALEIITDGGGSGVMEATITVLLTRT